MANEEALREEAVALLLQGVSVTEVSRRLGRSRQWVDKWKKRYVEGSEQWSASRSRAPLVRPSQTPESVEQAVVESRKRLDESPYMESGAYAIWHDLKNMGIAPPSVATINRILSSHGMTRKKARYTKSGIDYPDVPLLTQIMDLIGPRYIRGGQLYYLLTIICNETRWAGVYPILSKNGMDVTRSVVEFWKSFTVPDYLQMDNELSFKGSNRYPKGLGLLLRTALSLNVTPRFIPVSEPWRNGVIERFNQKVEKTLLNQQHASFKDLQRHAREFVETHNSVHHYSPLEHKTPLQLVKDLDLPIVPLRADYVVGDRPRLDSGNLNEIDFIRLVRSDLLIDVLNTEVEIVPELAYTYVEAKLLINEHQLQIRHNNTLYQTVDFVMPTE